MKPWHFRNARSLIYASAGLAAVGVAGSAKWGEPDFGQALVAARQLYGLWAMGFLLASLLLGPLTAVLPWIPFKSSWMYGRRAIGVSTLAFALLHVTAYVWSVLRRNWREFYTTGWFWVVGLILGVVVLIDMIALGFTSRDVAVKKMGGRKWKKLHQTIYGALLLAMVHSLFVGADFGWHRGPDVKGEADFGSLVAFASLSAAWLALALLRRRNSKWTPKYFLPKLAPWTHS